MPSTTLLFELLAELKIKTTTVEHEPVATVAEAKTKLYHLPGAHCKSLLVRDKKKRHWLLIIAHDSTKVDLDKISRQLGLGRLGFASTDSLWHFLQVTPGSVTPFALIAAQARDIMVILDQKLLAYDTANFHPLRNNASTNIAVTDLLRFIQACGNELIIMELTD